MAATFVAYIDESGDEGFRFEEGSSHWFVLSAIICRKTDELRMVDIAKATRQVLNKPEGHELHFRKLRHEHRIPFLHLIRDSNFCAMSVLVHKPSFDGRAHSFKEAYKLYHYMIRFLLERIGWYCRDNFRGDDAGDGSVELIFSNRKRMSYDNIREYIDLLLSGAKIHFDGVNVFDIRLSGEIIKTSQLRTFQAGQRAGLQIADAVASSVFHAVELSKVGYLEERYLRILGPILYRYKNGKCFSYGLKFFPLQADDLARINPQLKWICEEFK